VLRLGERGGRGWEGEEAKEGGRKATAVPDGGKDAGNYTAWHSFGLPFFSSARFGRRSGWVGGGSDGGGCGVMRGR
jgi:hypothetical protein